MKNNIKLAILISGLFIFQGVYSDDPAVRLPRQILKDIQLASEIQFIEAQCNLGNDIHPASKTILADYQENRISTEEFLRTFSLPNSGDVGSADCVVLHRSVIEKLAG